MIREVPLKRNNFKDDIYNKVRFNFVFFVENVLPIPFWQTF